MKVLCGIAGVACFLLVSRPALAQGTTPRKQPASAGAAIAAEGPSTGPDATEAESWRDDPRLGGRTGKLRYRVARGPDEWVDTPDVVTLRDGTKLEAYWLEVYGDWFVFYVKETGATWLKEQIPRSYVANVEFDKYLPRDPVAPRAIRAAEKQPVPKGEVLSGVFEGTQGKYTRWTFSFRSEIDKRRRWAEDATEYGTFRLESDFEQRAAGDVFAHAVKARGEYFLYAPGTIGNEQWVLVLSDVVERQIDYSPEKSYVTDRIPDETFILRFSPDRETFRLAWSNVGLWSWTPLVRVEFQRVPSPGPAEEREPGPADWRRAPRGRGASPGRGRDERTERRPSRSLVAAREAERAPPRNVRHGRRWQVGDWGKPVTFWNGGR